MNPETAQWLDGPKLVAWLKRLHILTDPALQVGGNHASTLRKWELGVAASVYTADTVLHKLGVCLGEIPDEFYREPPDRTTNKTGKPISSEKVAQIRRLRRRGLSFAEIGRRVGVSGKSAARYGRAA